jgi:UDP-N-acetylmuramoylalanine--D-glutamate ligase
MLWLILLTQTPIKKVMKKTDYTIIVGLGKTGLSAVRYCLRENIPFVIADSRENPPGLDELKKIAPEIKIYLGHLNVEILEEFSDRIKQIIVSPGVSLKEPLIQSAISKHIPIVGDIELFAQKIKAPVIAITGSNGKTTVTTLVGDIAKKAGLIVKVAGNIGTPVLDLLIETEPDLYVLELSSFQLESTNSLKPKVACLLNIQADHMDRYDTLEEYTEAKMRVFMGCESAVIHHELKAAIEKTNLTTFHLLSSSKNIYGLEGEDLSLNKKSIISINDLKLTAKHQIENALAAIAIADAAGIDRMATIQTLKTFTGLPHRCECIAKIDGVKYIDDSKGTNVGATLAAIYGLEKGKNIILIAGGVGKNQDFSPLKEPIQKHVKTLILIGDASDQLKQLFNSDEIRPIIEKMSSSRGFTAGSSVLNLDAAVNPRHDDPAFIVCAGYDFKVAIDLAKKAANIGDIVLLSPACASFDMFDNYEHRGSEFKKWVKNEIL